MFKNSCVYPKLLYIPNETNIGDQIGPRRTFEDLNSSKKLNDYKTFSFLNELLVCKSEKIVLEKLYNLAINFQPDIILWQHIGDFNVSKEFLFKLKDIKSQPTLVYHEGDMYGRFRRKLPKAVRNFVSVADLVFVVGLGYFSDMLKSFGAKKIVYSPSCADVERFGNNFDYTSERKYGVTLIGNKVTSKLPFSRMPGAAKREKLVKGLYNMLGEEFAVFGYGWEDIKVSKGPIPYNAQHNVIRQGWINVGWNHFDSIPYYFSDRLPIALLSGVAHVTNSQPGYENIFKQKEELIYTNTVENTLETIEDLLCLSKDELIGIGTRGRKYALENLTSHIVFTNILKRIIEHRYKNT